jgi:hypothetical protein
MAERTLVCVGGPADGQWKTLPAGATFCEVAERLEDPGPLVRGPTYVRGLDIRIHLYRVVTLVQEDGAGREIASSEVKVLSAEGMTAAEMLRRLVANYKPPAPVP